MLFRVTRCYSIRLPEPAHNARRCFQEARHAIGGPLRRFLARQADRQILGIREFRKTVLVSVLDVPFKYASAR
jgi:hypothetical protein